MRRSVLGLGLVVLLSEALQGQGLRQKLELGLFSFGDCGEPLCLPALVLAGNAHGRHFIPSAEAGNAALRGVSTGGLFVGGGIAPKILPALTDGRFMRAFRSKSPFEALLSAMPVKVILNAEIALLGAAVFAARKSQA